MFTGQITVKRLRPREISLKTVNDINELLRSQHSEAKKIDEATLIVKTKRSKVVVAFNDGERIIGMGVLVKNDATLSYSSASIHHFLVRDGSDRLSIGKQIVDLLLEDVEAGAFIEASAHSSDGDLINLLTVCGFKLSLKLRYRLKLRKKSKRT